VATLDIEGDGEGDAEFGDGGSDGDGQFSEEVKRGVRAVGEISGQLGQIIEKGKR